MQRPQKTAQVGCPCEGMLETESNRGACSIALTETDRRDGAEDLLERILDRGNLNKAYLKVKRNGGSAGVDGMTVSEMLPYLKEHREELLTALRNGWYKPQAVRRVEIPKPDGGVRKLGVPTVIDRMIQQAIVQVLQPMYEPLFSDSSYGFRPKRSAHQAISKALEYYEQGYRYVVDLDLAKYFDTVNHAILIGMLREQIRDERVVKLIHKFLRSGALEHGLVSPTREGTPQGGNLSPLLSNIYLTAFDRLLESRGHKFVRYADDCNIYVKSRRAAERVMANCVKFLEGALKLTVNQTKSQVGSPLRLKFLGFSLYNTGRKAGIRPHQKSIKRFKDKIRELTSRKQARSVELILKRLKRYTTGWLGYYAIDDMESHMKRLTEWVRRRIRQIYWKQWKKIKTKHDIYTLHGDYLLPDLKLPEQPKVEIGVFGQRHKRYLKEHHRLIYFNLLTSCKLAAYLADIDSKANNMYDLLVRQLSEKENITEQLKAENPMEWTHKMNAIRITAAEIVNREIIYT